MLIKIQNDEKKLGLSKETLKIITSLLRNADLVKFAKAKPLSNEIEGDRKCAELIIKKIQPKIIKYKSSIILPETEKVINTIKTDIGDVE